MMAAIRAAAFEQEVTLIEKNSFLGKKLLLTGKGRCNLTNTSDLDSFLKRFSKNGPFLRDAFKVFFNHDLMNFFQERGLPLKIERQLRVFPETGHSASIVDILKKELIRSKVKIIFNHRVKEIVVSDNQVRQVKLENLTILEADRVIVATGGQSYSFTGSSGDGYLMAEKLGHTIKELKPGLVALEVKEKYVKSLEGLTLKNIRLKFVKDQDKINSEVGELVFTDSGVSGPLVLTLSGVIFDWLSERKEVFVSIDLKPALSQEQLDLRILREIKTAPKKTVRNIFKSLLPLKLVDLFIRLAGISQDKKASLITQEERRKIASLLKSWRFAILRTGPLEKAMVTRGGVSLKEINPRTMESRLIKGLYFAGEVIDIDADTGGFNLQAAFSTGYLAGQSAALI
jgi:predicted Rossmann fold flavoprotein